MRLLVAAFARDLAASHVGLVVCVQFIVHRLAAVTGNAVALPRHDSRAAVAYVDDVAAGTRDGLRGVGPAEVCDVAMTVVA